MIWQTITVPAITRPDTIINGRVGIPVEQGTPLGMMADILSMHADQIAEVRTWVLLQSILIVLLAACIVLPPRFWRWVWTRHGTRKLW